MPLLGRQVGMVLIILLTRPAPRGLDLVDGRSPSKERSVGLAEASLAAGLLVDLDFVSGMHRREGCIVWWIDGIGRWVGQSRIAEANEDA